MPCSKEDEFLRQYQRLCANPLRTDEQLVCEYELLKQNPRVVSLGFYRPDVLMVGTDEIVISYQNERYLIGEFIIFLVRRQVDEYWEVDFRFWNVTHPICREAEGAVAAKCYIHPHILEAIDNLLDCPNGSLCISRGQFSIYQHLRKGEMHHAASSLIEVLETYPTGRPYHDAYNWPKWERNNA